MMIIAVTYENGSIYQHFGHTAQFKLYQVQEGKIVDSNIVDTNGNGHGALAGFLKEHNVEVVICGGIGAGAKTALAEAGIQLFGGVIGAADEQVSAYLAGTLQYNQNIECNHHGQDHKCKS